MLLLMMLVFLAAWCAKPGEKQFNAQGNDDNQLLTKPPYATIVDTMPPRIPLSKRPYYPDREVPSEKDGSIISGGRFNEMDMANIVFHWIKNPNPTNGNNVLVRVDFFDMDNQLRGSYDVKANNPYKPENYKSFLSESYLNADVSIVDRRKYPDYNWRKDVRHYASFTMIGGSNECETLVLSYFLEALGEDKTLLGITATFVLLDNTGKEITRFKDIQDVFFGEGIVTCDQKYFCLQYGGEFTVNLQRMYNDHFRIYDVETKKILYDWELPETHQFLSAPIERPGNWVKINEAMGHQEMINNKYTTTQIQHVFDIKNRLKYTSPIEVRLNYVRSFFDGGFVIQDPNTRAFEKVWYKDWKAEKF